MPDTIACFGEVLWDLLPQGRFLGGAPLNVAYHLHRLGATPWMLSAVGHDALGDETLDRLRTLGLDCSGIARPANLPTGIVRVHLQAGGQPRYEIVEQVAWDAIPVPAGWSRRQPEIRAIVFGTLALREPANRQTLTHLLSVPGPLRVLDVNLRPPFAPPGRVLELARQADFIKLNHEELGVLTDHPGPLDPDNDAALQPALREFTARIGPQPVCLTLGAAGAVLAAEGQYWRVKAPRVEVADTIGAGDAFTAALVRDWLRRPAGSDPRPLLERAAALGALVASRPGAQPEYDPAPWRA